MKLEKFNEIVERRIQSIRDSLVKKGAEYARGEDRLWNFKRGASISKKSLPRTVEGYLTKHIASFYDIIDDYDKGIHPSKELINEKFGDIINYMMLMEAVLLEEEESPEGKVVNFTERLKISSNGPNWAVAGKSIS
jgi:hypothetical protein